MIPIGVSLRHYKRKDVAEAIVEHAEDREVAVKFGDRFGQRPDMLRHASDVLELAKKGATSFHSSEERWQNPLTLNPNLRREELDKLRKGWDLVLDIDCAVFEYSRIAAQLLIKALEHHGIKSMSIKFSGNKGFHIGVPFEAMPPIIMGKDASDVFPEAPRRIANYLRDMIAAPLGAEIMSYEEGALDKVVAKTGAERSRVVKEATDSLGRKSLTLEAEPFLKIDTVLIASRHMYRMPYSLHEKSGLVSVPIALDEVPSFKRNTASPKSFAVSDATFLERKADAGSAEKLIVQAFDAKPVESEVEKRDREFEIPAEAVPEALFPPCIKKILAGLSDGRKRAVFILINFLRVSGWDYDAIEARLREWNQLNHPPLREVLILGQLRYHKQQQKNAPPPNCNNTAYYSDMGVKCEEKICSRMKNPVSYSRRRRLIR